MHEFDWNLLRTFRAVAEAGSITLAATELGISQPTASRQMRALEDALGVPLVARHGRGIRLTDRGAELAAAAAPIADDVRSFLRLAQGARDELRGSLRIAATEIFGTHVVVPLLCEMRRELPHIDVELVLDNRAHDLVRGEADLAIRMFRPTGGDLVGRQLGAVPTGLFASRDYLDRAGEPTSLEGLLDHALVGFDARGPMGSMYQRFDTRLAPERFWMRTDSLVAQFESVLHGGGIGGLQLELARRHPTLVQVLGELPIPPMPLWLVMHEDIRSGAHIRAVFNYLAEALSAYTGAIEA